MNVSARSVLVGALAVAVCVACILLGIYPYRPANIWGWLVLILIAVPVLWAYELVGKKFFSPSSAKGMSRTARIAYGLVVALIVIAASWLLFKTAEPYLTTWGS